MSIVHFRHLRNDTKKILLEVDKATSGKIDIALIKDLHFRLGCMTGRINERIKDLVKYSPKRKDYMDLLNELDKRRIKLEGLIDRYANRQVQMKSKTIVIRCAHNQEVNNIKSKI